MSSYSNNIAPSCCLVDNGQRCWLRPGNTTFNKRLQRLVQEKHLKFHLDQHARHSYICDRHKDLILSSQSPQNKESSATNSARLTGANGNAKNSVQMSPTSATNPTNSKAGVRRPRTPADKQTGENSSSSSPEEPPSSLRKRDESAERDLNEFDFQQLPVSVLRRYRRHFNLHLHQTKRSNKTQLAVAITHHFFTIRVDERETINRFLTTVARTGGPQAQAASRSAPRTNRVTSDDEESVD